MIETALLATPRHSQIKFIIVSLYFDLLHYSINILNFIILRIPQNYNVISLFWAKASLNLAHSVWPLCPNSECRNFLILSRHLASCYPPFLLPFTVFRLVRTSALEARVPSPCIRKLRSFITCKTDQATCVSRIANSVRGQIELKENYLTSVHMYTTLGPTDCGMWTTKLMSGNLCYL